MCETSTGLLVAYRDLSYGVYMCRESWARKRLFPVLRDGHQGPASHFVLRVACVDVLCYMFLCVYIFVWYVHVCTWWVVGYLSFRFFLLIARVLHTCFYFEMQ